MDKILLSAKPTLEYLHLTKLEQHSHVLIFSTIACQLIYLIMHPISTISSVSYVKLSPIKKIDWRIHCVSMVHSTLICLLALPIFFDLPLVTDKIFGYSSYAGDVYALTCG